MSLNKNQFSATHAASKKQFLIIQLLKLCVVVNALTMCATVLGQSQLKTVSISPTSQNPWRPLAFAVPQFNPNLGVLKTVKLTITPQLGIFGSLLSGDPTSAQVATGCTVTHPYGALTDTALGLTATYTNSQTLTSPSINVPDFLFMIFGPPLPFVFTNTPGSVSVSPTGFTGSGFTNLTFTQTHNAGFTGGGNGWSSGYYGYVGGSLQVEYGYTIVPPSPSISHSGGSVVLLWTTNTVQNYQLVHSCSLSSTNWTALTNAPLVTNGSNVLTLSPTNAWEFFRLLGTNN